jgi:hypothetical protein
MVELMVAIAISAVILVGSGAALRAMLVSTGDSSDKVLARLEVQYANFWISEDVMQATEVYIGNISDVSYPTPFTFLQLFWNTWPYGEGQVHTVEYSIEDMKDKLDRNLWRLYRTTDSDITNPTTTVVAEYLDPLLTSCTQKQLGNGTLINVLVLEVASQVDDKMASGSYEINPRASTVTWGVLD